MGNQGKNLHVNSRRIAEELLDSIWLTKEHYLLKPTLIPALFFFASCYVLASRGRDNRSARQLVPLIPTFFTTTLLPHSHNQLAIFFASIAILSYCGAISILRLSLRGVMTHNLAWFTTLTTLRHVVFSVRTVTALALIQKAIHLLYL